MASTLLRISSALKQLPRYTSHVDSSRVPVLNHVFTQTSSHLRAYKGSRSSPVPQTPKDPGRNKPLPSFNLLQQVRDSRPAVRYTVYAGLGVMVTVESTFWFNVIKAKFFPPASEEDKEKADEYMERIREAITGYKANWMQNYGRYYGGYVWGVGER